MIHLFDRYCLWPGKIGRILRSLWSAILLAKLMTSARYPRLCVTGVKSAWWPWDYWYCTLDQIIWVLLSDCHAAEQAIISLSASASATLVLDLRRWLQWHRPHSGVPPQLLHPWAVVDHRPWICCVNSTWQIYWSASRLIIWYNMSNECPAQEGMAHSSTIGYSCFAVLRAKNGLTLQVALWISINALWLYFSWLLIWPTYVATFKGSCCSWCSSWDCVSPFFAFLEHEHLHCMSSQTNYHDIAPQLP